MLLDFITMENKLKIKMASFGAYKNKIIINHKLE